MERITEKSWANLDPWECCGQDNFCKRGCHDQGGCTNGCIVPKIYARLAAYEDTGFMPNEIAMQKVLNTPLTLREIKKMCGEPVWIHLRNNKGFWAIIKGHSKKSDAILFYGTGKISCKAYKKWWLAYRNKKDEDIQ